MFSNQMIGLNDADRIKYYCSKAADLAASNNNLWTFVGEWTPAPTDCAGKIPGVNYSATPLARGSPSRYDGTQVFYCFGWQSENNSLICLARFHSFPGSNYHGSCQRKTGNSAQWSPQYKVSMRKFYEVQTSVYESAASGWIMWTWKMGTAHDWSYQAGLAGGWIPQNPGEKLYVRFFQAFFLCGVEW